MNLHGTRRYLERSAYPTFVCTRWVTLKKYFQVIVPPYYWGVNHVTGSFPGSIDIRPEVMTELMTDVFRSLAKAGFRQVFCITGHYDAAAFADAIAASVR